MSSSNEIVDLITSVWRGRKAVGLVACAAAVVAAIVSLILPLGFEARSSILPSEGEGGSLASTLAAAGAALPAGLITAPKTPEAIFVEMLESRIVRTAVIEQLDLITRYGIDEESRDLALELARRQLDSQVTVGKRPSGLVTIRVMTTTPWFPFLFKESQAEARHLAAEIANTLVDRLNAVNQERSTSRARNSRIYLESQLERTRVDLEVAADSLVAFQRRHATLSVDEQARVTIETLGVLKGRIIAKEIEEDVLERTMTPGTFELQSVRIELEALSRRYDELLRGPSDAPATGSTFQDLYDIPVAGLPDIAMELLRRTRELHVQQTVYELLTQQYYQTKLEEARDVPTVQVLDTAIPPPTKTRPQRKLIVALALVGGLLAGSAWVAFRGGALT